jgi:hypothetical protein
MVPIGVTSYHRSVNVQNDQHIVGKSNGPNDVMQPVSQTFGMTVKLQVS